MPSYEAVVDGKIRKIELYKASQNTFTAQIDGKPHKVELQSDKLDLEQPFNVKINGKTYRIQIPKGTENGKALQVNVEDIVFQTEVRTPIRREAVTSFQPTPQALTRRPAAATTKQATSEGAVTAPMTGKIVRIQVKKGDMVKQNQVLCVIEAMKMENEITATRAGTVQEVSVSVGSPVNEGDVLVVVG
jgi:biotin carboxyl carrier protein